MSTTQIKGYNAVILTYHSIDESGSVISTSPSRFYEQMRTLERSSYDVVSLNQIVDLIKGGRPFGNRKAAITFDDGYQNFYDQAHPLLKKWGFPVTVFVIPRLCGLYSRWKGQVKGASDLRLMGLDELKQLADEGIEFGAHTLTHPKLTAIAPSRAVQEIVDSKAELEQHISREVRFFAYPFGAFNRQIKDVVRKTFPGACSASMGFANFRSDPYALPRVDMYYFSKNNLFSLVESGLFSFYLVFRKALRFSKKLASN